ncbi:ribonuclease P protein subunit rpr2-like isoform X2 [Coccinella septempunctata]|uniref:ribonuclease P protein subunit rpr2-like isoform X2 n=1 Tax=Coccinella septempunctata TaxID=41139 RepID=UPI001D085F77|nr:ribonuclease P protein subunit rpr2-like isoform X2 [Coccinella septempunctata]
MSRPKKCPAKESLERINYLYQIANQLMDSNSANTTVSKSCSNLMIQVSKKSVQRIDVDMKRRICKACKTLLLPGINCKVRIKKKNLKWSCNTCQNTKLFPTMNYEPVWSQKDESIVEILDYGKS